MITLTEGHYTLSELAGHLQVILNNYYNDPTFPPQRSDMFVVSHSDLLNKIRISVNYNDITFQILPDNDILTHPAWFPDINGAENIKSISRVLGNSTSTTRDFNNSCYSGFLDLQRVKNIFIYVVMKLATSTN